MRNLPWQIFENSSDMVKHSPLFPPPTPIQGSHHLWWSIYSHSDCLIRIVAINSHTRWQTVQIFRSQLIWIYTVCKGRVYPGSAEQGLKYRSMDCRAFAEIKIIYKKKSMVVFILKAIWHFRKCDHNPELPGRSKVNAFVMLHKMLLKG